MLDPKDPEHGDDHGEYGHSEPVRGSAPQVTLPTIRILRGRNHLSAGQRQHASLGREAAALNRGEPSGPTNTRRPFWCRRLQRTYLTCWTELSTWTREAWESNGPTQRLDRNGEPSVRSPGGLQLSSEPHLLQKCSPGTAGALHRGHSAQT